MEGLRVSDAKLVVYIHPSKANKVPQAILRELSSLLFNFSEMFDGVVLAYDVTVPNRGAKILSGVTPYFGVNLKAKLLLFSPKPDMLVEGKVVKLGKESIHIIVLGFSSASVMEDQIRKEFKYRIKNGEEVLASRSHKRHIIKVGSIVRFIVKSFDEEILHISGSLIPSHTGSVSWLEKHSEEAQVVRDVKRDMETEKEKSECDPGSLSDGTLLHEDHHHAKKSKRRRTEDDS